MGWVSTLIDETPALVDAKTLLPSVAINSTPKKPKLGETAMATPESVTLFDASMLSTSAFPMVEPIHAKHGPPRTRGQARYSLPSTYKERITVTLCCSSHPPPFLRGAHC